MDISFFVLVALILLTGSICGLISAIQLFSVRRRLNELEMTNSILKKKLFDEPHKFEERVKASNTGVEAKPEPKSKPAPTPTAETDTAFIPKPIETKHFIESEPVLNDTSKSEREDLETQIGGLWFNRIGLMFLIISFALLAGFIHPHLQAWHKLALSYLASAGLFGLGYWFETQLKTFSRPVMAGGLALAFFTSFAAHFIPAMACLGLWSSLILMTLSVVGIFLCAEWWKSESTAGMAIFLGHVAAYTAGGNADSFSLVAILFLTLTAIFLFLRHNWILLNLGACCAAYVSHGIWAVQDHLISLPENAFWINFVFLTTYYGSFLCADLLYQFRLNRTSFLETQNKQHSASRAISPVSLILYSILTILLFLETEVYWDYIYIYLFALAVVQTTLYVYFLYKQHSDSPFYVAAATIFLTLGLFSLTGGLTLNVTLAAEALLLLILSRWLNLWALYPLAQLVLVVNFIHFWVSDASQIETYPAFLGASLTALVYFVKSRIEETWSSDSDDKSMAKSKSLSEVQSFFKQTTFPLSCLHAIIGSMIFSYQITQFVSPHWESIVWIILLFALVLSFVTYYLKSVSFGCGAGVGLICTHFVYYTQLPISNSVVEFPGLTITLLLLTLLSGGVLELIYRREKSNAQFVKIGMGVFYTLTFLLGNTFFHSVSDYWFVAKSATVPVQTLFALMILILSLFAKFKWLQSISLGYVLIWLIPKTIVFAVSYQEFQISLVFTALITFAQVMLIDWLVFSSKYFNNEQFKKQTVEQIHNTLVISTAVMMMVATAFSEEIRGTLTTFSWSLLAMGLALIGFGFKDRIYRRTALGVFILTIVRVMLIDASQLSEIYRIVAFMALGICLIAVSFLYARFRKNINEWL